MKTFPTWWEAINSFLVFAGTLTPHDKSFQLNGTTLLRTSHPDMWPTILIATIPGKAADEEGTVIRWQVDTVENGFVAREM